MLSFGEIRMARLFEMAAHTPHPGFVQGEIGLSYLKRNGCDGTEASWEHEENSELHYYNKANEVVAYETYMETTPGHMVHVADYVLI